MKNLKVLFLVMILAVVFTGCKKCKNENPRARIINNGTHSASVQIKTSGGNTENINNVALNTTSDFRSYAPGNVTYTVTVNKIEFVETVNMSSCYEYDIIITQDNTILAIPTDRNEK